MTAGLHIRPAPAACRQPVRFYSIRAWSLCFGWYEHWWAMGTILSRPEYQVWQEWEWNHALGIHSRWPFQILTPLTGASPANHACAPTTTPLRSQIHGFSRFSFLLRSTRSPWGLLTEIHTEPRKDCKFPQLSCVHFAGIKYKSESLYFGHKFCFRCHTDLRVNRENRHCLHPFCDKCSFVASIEDAKPVLIQNRFCMKTGFVA